jgi:hypothetical protein
VRRCVGVLALAAALIAVGGSTASERIDWTKIKYVHLGSTSDATAVELYVSSGKGWGGRPVKQLEPLPLGLVPAWAQKAKLVPQPIWTQSCPAKAEAAVFSFGFQAPGPAKEADLLVESAGFGETVTSAVVSLNGKLLHTSGPELRDGNYEDVKLDAKALKALRYGQNEIRIRATKPALPKGVACNRGNAESSTDRHVGILVALRATFNGDMQTEPPQSFQGFPLVTIDPHIRRVYVDGTKRTSQAIISALVARDAGPAAGVAGQIIVTGTGDASLQVALGSGSGLPAPSAPAPFAACQTEQQSNALSFKVTCPYGDFPPGKQVAVTIGWGWSLTSGPNFTQRQATLSWEVGGYGDDNGPGEASLQVVVCGKQATDPGCKNAQ